MNEIALSELAKTQWKEYSMSVITDRAIPNFADGLKPVQRYLLYEFFKEPNTQKKVAAWAGNLAEQGYDHGEASGADALIKMTSEYLNNIPLFIGQGNFGTFLEKQAPAAARYIFAKLSKITNKIFLDNDQVLVNPDPEQKPPMYYLPIIPMVLVNGVVGIATGWACNIPPHSPISIIDALLALCKGKKPKDIIPQYPYFNGIITRENNSYITHGLYDFISSNKIHITELPPDMSQEEYHVILDKLEEKGKIVSYEDNSKRNSYDIVVVLKRGTKYTNEELEKLLKLKSSDSWNINTISPDGKKLQEWDPNTGFMDIIQEFYKFRLPIIEERIHRIIEKLKTDIQYYNAYIKFAKDVVAKRFDFRIDENQFRSILKNNYNVPDCYIEKVMNKPTRSFTVENIKKAEDELLVLEDSLQYYTNTTPEKEYIKNLEELKKELL